MKTPLTKQIENQQTELNRLRDQLNELVAARRARRRTARPCSSNCPAIIDEANKQLDRLQAAEKALGFRAAEDTPDEIRRTGRSSLPDKRPFAMPKKKIEPADYVLPRGRGRTAGIRHADSGRAVIRENYGNDEATQIITRAAVNPATTTATGYAAELVQTGFGAFMDRLLADSIYAPLSAAGTRYDLGRNGTLKIPYRATTPLASGAWVGEGAPKPVKRIGLATVDAEAAQDLVHHHLHRGNGDVLGAGDRGHPAQGDGRRHPGLARRLPDRCRGGIGNAAGRPAGRRLADHRIGGGDVAGEDRRRHQCADRADGSGRRRRQYRPADEPGAGAQDRHGADNAQATSPSASATEAAAKFGVKPDHLVDHDRRPAG